LGRRRACRRSPTARSRRRGDSCARSPASAPGRSRRSRGRPSATPTPSPSGTSTFPTSSVGPSPASLAAPMQGCSISPRPSVGRWRIRQGAPVSYMAAAREIDRSNADVVCVQHEFGLYGHWKGGGYIGDQWLEGTYEDHLTPFLEELKKPALVTLHTVLPEPSPAIRDAVRMIAESAHGLVVMAETAVGILHDVYGIAAKPTVIHHGMPHIEPKGR